MSEPTASPAHATYAPPPAQQQRGNATAITGFIIAAVAFLLCLIPVINYFALILAIVGLILGIIGLVGANRGRKHRGLAVAAIVVSVLAGIGALASQALYGATLNELSSGLDEVSDSVDRAAGGSTDEILAEDLTVEMGPFEGTADEFGMVTSRLPVTLTNIADEAYSYSVHIEAVDSSGARVGEDWAYSSELGAGQSESFDLFAFVTQEDLGKLQGATFQIVEVTQM